jgi:bisphosphoglycerate-independent phosphoglycerate mutase (AlkP superfamily)
LIDNSDYKIKDGGLADIAPTILDILNLSPSAEMNGHSLLIK